MPGRKDARHLAPKMRLAAEKALREAYGKGGIEALQACWVDLLKKEGPGQFLKVLALFCPKEVHVQDDNAQIPVVGQIPPDPMAWARQMGLPQVVTLDQETGEVIDDESGKQH